MNFIKKHYITITHERVRLGDSNLNMNVSFCMHLQFEQHFTDGRIPFAG